MEAEPLGRQQVDGLDVGPLDQLGQPVAGGAAELLGLQGRPARDLVVDGADLEPVLHPGQRRLVPGFPEPAQADHTDPEPDASRRGQGGGASSRGARDRGRRLGMALAAAPHRRLVRTRGLASLPTAAEGRFLQDRLAFRLDPDAVEEF